MAALSISNLIDYLRGSHFADDWITQHSWIQNDEQDSKSLVINAILSGSQEILIHHSLFLLVGEYVIIPNDEIKNNLAALEAFLTERSQLIEIPSNETIQNEIQDFFYNNVVELVRNYIYTRLNAFDRDIKNQLVADDKRKIFRAHLKSQYKFPDENKVFQDYRYAFTRILDLLVIEHFEYRFDELTVRKLLLIKKEVDLLTVADFIRVSIIVKIDFLLKKLFYRNKERDNKFQNLIYSFGLQPDEEINLDNITLHNGLEQWERNIQIHYGFITDFKKQQRKQVNEIYEEYQSTGYISLFGDYRSLIKKFKDDSKSVENITNLLTQFKQIVISGRSLIDKYAKRITYSYLFNNSISLTLEDTNLKLTDFTELYNGIRNQQNEFDVKNYFPWKRLAEVLSSRIDSLADDLTDKENFKSFQELMSLYIRVIDKFEESLKWCDERSLIPFQLTYEECKSNYEIPTHRHGMIPLYFFSSKVLPLCYESIKREFEQLNLKKLKYDTLSSTYRRLRKVVEEVEDTSSKLRNQERRSIEILAIFSAISLFSVGSIQIFTQEAVIKDPAFYYKFIFSFGYSLMLFVLIIWIITRDNIKKVQWVHWVLIGTIILSSLIVIGYFVGVELMVKFLDLNKQVSPLPK